MPDLIQGGEAKQLRTRKLTQETCKKWSYEIGMHRSANVQIANYLDNKGTVVAQKVRRPNKEFLILGDPKKMTLYGQWLWRDGGKMVIVTEGEIDALSMSQALNHKYPVVSVPNGAQAAAKSIRSNLEYLEQFDRVVFMFDQDEPGQAAAVECAELLTPGRAYIASLSEKDANAMLVEGKIKELIEAQWSAKLYRPDGIISGDDIQVSDLYQAPSTGYTVPYPGINEMNRGIRKGELTLFTAGTGIGKTTLVREIGHHLVTAHGLRIGNIFLEESYRKTIQGYLAIEHDIPLGRFREDPRSVLTEEQVEAGLDKLVRGGRMAFYNHFGSMESEHLIAKLRYFAVGLQCDFILLDHISMVVSGQEGSGQGERKDIDVLMTHLRSLIENTGVGVIAIVHLKQPGGKPHEEGGRVTLTELRGSGALKHVPDSIIALERDQQGEQSNQSLIRQLKNREWGDNGPAGYVEYHPDTGRLLPCDAPVESADSYGFDNHNDY
jgi:twinkle protein